MEFKLLNWLNELKSSNKTITSTMIQKKAKEFSKHKDFLASTGWLNKFKKRFRI